MSGSDLGDVLGELDHLVAVAGGARVAVTAEALERGEIASSQYAGTAAWVAGHAPSLATGPAPGQIARLLAASSKPDVEPVRDAVIAGQLGVPVALVVLGEFDKLKDRVAEGAAPLILDGLISIAAAVGARGARQLRQRLLAEHGAPGEFQDAQDRAARQVALSHGHCVDEDGVWEYRLRLDAEAKAILEAAIGPLSAPYHSDGHPDLRSPQQRRAHALIEACRRVSTAAAAAGPFGGHPQPDPHEHDREHDGTASGETAAGRSAATGAPGASVVPEGAALATASSGQPTTSDLSRSSASREAGSAGSGAGGGAAGSGGTSSDGQSVSARQTANRGEPARSTGTDPTNRTTAPDGGGGTPAGGGHPVPSSSASRGGQPPPDPTALDPSLGDLRPVDRAEPDHSCPDPSWREPSWADPSWLDPERAGRAPAETHRGGSEPIEPQSGQPSWADPSWLQPDRAGPEWAGPEWAGPPASGPQRTGSTRRPLRRVDLDQLDTDGVDPAAVRAALAGIGAGGGKATLLVTMTLNDLRAGTGAATTLGSLDAPSLLGPDTARRIACDAGIIPVVLGTDGEVLDLGRTHRLFSTAQTRALLLRDRHCTFPGCDVPGFWADAHHLKHWVDGGATDLSNASLLCGRHHTIVHRDRLTATVTTTGVLWDITPGSYDRPLTDRYPAA